MNDKTYIYLNVSSTGFNTDEKEGFLRFLKNAGVQFTGTPPNTEEYVEACHFNKKSDANFEALKNWINKRLVTRVLAIMSFIGVPTMIKLGAHFYQQPDFEKTVDKIAFVNKKVLEINKDFMEKNKEQIKINEQLATREERRKKLAAMMN
jgi:hypothetical protein